MIARSKEDQKVNKEKKEKNENVKSFIIFAAIAIGVSYFISRRFSSKEGDL